MNTQAKVIIGGLAAAVIVLSIVLGVALAGDDDNDGLSPTGLGSDSYMGMLSAFGRMDSVEMLSMKRSVLGPQGYNEMLEHFAEHRSGTQMPYGSGIDGRVL